MSLPDLLETLAQRRVTVFLDGDRLRYRAPTGGMTNELKTAIDAHRAAIMDFLRGPGIPVRASGECSTCDRSDWTDAPPQDGRIRTTCGQCGRFIGYRPANLRP